jgi:choline dehydrogenase
VACYYLFGGRMMAGSAPELTALLSTRNRPDWPNIQLGISPFSPAIGQDGKPVPGRGALDRSPGITFVGFQLRPDGRGSVRLVSKDPAIPVWIDADYLKTLEDRRQARELLAVIRAFAGTPRLKGIVGTELIPGNPGQISDDQLRHLVVPGLHDVGTCAIGAVLTTQLAVKGMAGLRIADCSAIPYPTSANTNAPAMVIGYRAAGFALGED